MDAETRDVLVGAKAALARGWIQGQMTQGDSVCLIGALYVASGLARDSWEWGAVAGGPIGRAHTLLLDEVWRDGLLVSLPAWNDAWGQTQENVIALVDRVLLKNKVEADESVPAEEVYA